MRTSWLSLSLLTLTLSTGCPDDPGTTATTSSGPTTTADESSTTNSTSNDDPDTNEAPDTNDTENTGEGLCAHQCMADADCMINGQDLGFTCIDSVCTGASSGACMTDDECVAQLSGWTAGFPCTAGGNECELSMQVCLEFGHCVTGPNDNIMCVNLGLDEIEATDIDGNPVTVCGQANATCNEDGICFLPCGADADCPMPLPICDTNTGICQCGTDADCEMLNVPAQSVCHSGVCGCSDNQQCSDANLGDLCTSDGLCGCSDDQGCAAVETQFDGGALVCVM